MLAVCALLCVSSGVAFAAASVNGTIWIDKNGNGTIDEGKRVQHVPIYLRANTCNGEIVAATTTASNGTYLFSGVADGSTYVIQVVNPAAGFNFTNAGPDMDVNSGTGCSAPEPLSNNENWTVNAGFRRVARTQFSCDSVEIDFNAPSETFVLKQFNKPNATLNSVTLTLSGYFSHRARVTNNGTEPGNITLIFSDTMRVALPNASDFDYKPSPDIQVYFENVSVGVPTEYKFASDASQLEISYPMPFTVFEGAGTVNFDANGLSSFTGLFDGSGPVNLTIEGEWVAHGTLCATYGFAPPAQLGGRVYEDKNDNGVFDNGDVNKSGVQVCLYLSGEDNSHQCKYTNSNTSSVNFRFRKLPSLTYDVVVLPPSGFECRTPPLLDPSGIRPPGCWELGIVLDPGEVDLSHQFGLRRAVERELKDIIYDETNERLFVADRDNNMVLVYDANTLGVTNSVDVGQQPFGMALLNGRVYAANFNSNSVSVINASTLALITTINLNSGANCGTQPTHIAANPSTNKLYVALHGSGRVAVLDGATSTFSKCIDGVGGGTFGIAVNSALNRVYVTGRDSKDLRVINGTTDTQLDGQRQEFDESSPYQVTVDPNNDRVYVAVSIPVDHETVTRLFVYDADAGNLTPVAGSPFTIGNNHDGGGIGASACSGKIYVLEPDNNTVRVLNSNLTLNTTHAQTDPFGLTFGGGKVFITNRAPATISTLTDCP